MHASSSIVARAARLLTASNLWVAAAVTSLAAFTALHLGIDVAPAALGVVFACTMAIYNVDRFFDAAVASGAERRLDPRAHATLALLGLATAAALIARAPAPAAALVVVGGFACLGYGAPLPSALRRRGAPARIKEIPGAKSWFVAIAVTVATVAVPTAWAGALRTSLTEQPMEVAALAGLFLAMTIIDAHLFDIRDVEHDRADGVRTLPVLLGVRRTRLVLLAVIASWLVAACAAVVGWDMTLGPPPVAGLAALAVATFVLSPQSPGWAFDLLVDGALFVPWLVAQILGYA